MIELLLDVLLVMGTAGATMLTRRYWLPQGMAGKSKTFSQDRDDDNMVAAHLHMHGATGGHHLANHSQLPSSGRVSMSIARLCARGVVEKIGPVASTVFKLSEGAEVLIDE